MPTPDITPGRYGAVLVALLALTLTSAAAWWAFGQFPGWPAWVARCIAGAMCVLSGLATGIWCAVAFGERGW